MLAEKFQIYSVKITENTFVSQKNWICSFLLMRPGKNLSQVFIIISKADGNCPFLPNSVFWRHFFLRRKEGGRGRGWSWKKLPRLTKVLVTRFNKFHHLCNLYIFGLCFAIQWFSFKHAEVWRFFNLTDIIFTKEYNV